MLYDGPMLGHDILGEGFPIVILNDWLDDTSSWDAVRPWLDPELRWIFADLRGYGRSKAQTGAYDLAEAAADVLALADGLGLDRFVVVGHSMSSLIALDLAQHHPERVAKAVVVAPPPPEGQGVDATGLGQLEGLARADDRTRMLTLRIFWGDRLGDFWVAGKARRWRAAAEPEAVAGYAKMYACDGVPDREMRLAMPLLAVVGEEDAEPMRAAPVRAAWGPYAPELTVVAIRDSGHYPMQETPALLAAHMNGFFADL